MNRSTTNNQIVQQKPAGSGQEPTNIQRRTVIGGALAALLSFPGRIMAQGNAVPNDSFVVLLKGLYRPVVQGPNLGLSMVDLNDGSYSTTKICPVSGTPGNKNEKKAVGNFYAQFTGICVPTTSREARLRCASPVAMSSLFPTGSVGSTWKEPSN